MGQGGGIGRRKKKKEKKEEEGKAEEEGQEQGGGVELRREGNSLSAKCNSLCRIWILTLLPRGFQHEGTGTLVCGRSPAFHLCVFFSALGTNLLKYFVPATLCVSDQSL